MSVPSTPHPAFSLRPRMLLGWLTALRLAAGPAAALGTAAGLLVGTVMAVTMRSSQVISAPYQDWIAAAGLLLLWGAIGAIGGLTVLSPVDGDRDSGLCDTADAAEPGGARRA